MPNRAAARNQLNLALPWPLPELLLVGLLLLLLLLLLPLAVTRPPARHPLALPTVVCRNALCCGSEELHCDAMEPPRSCAVVDANGAPTALSPPAPIRPSETINSSSLPSGLLAA